MTARTLPTPAEIADPCGRCGTPVEPAAHRQLGDLPIVRAAYWCRACGLMWRAEWMDLVDD